MGVTSPKLEKDVKADVSAIEPAKMSEFRKLSVIVPPDCYERLVREAARRKVAGDPNPWLSAMVREAVSEYLSHSDSKAGSYDAIRDK